MSITLDGTGPKIIARFGVAISELTYPKNMTLHLLSPDSNIAELIPHGSVPWAGEGLPPPGTMCERKYGDEWKKTTVCGHSPDGKSWAAYYDDDKAGWLSAGYFRPIRTPEQIAAEERLAAINYMEIDAGMCATAFDGDPEARVWVENLIDKGWRKQVSE